MRKILIFSCALALALAFAQCGLNVEPEVTVSEAVVQSAKELKFDYVEVLEKARKGDQEAVTKFFDFHRLADGVDGLQHGITCLELIPFAGDANVAEACSKFKPGLKKLIFERLVYGQANTKKEDLKKPLEQNFPSVYKAFNIVIQPDTLQKDSTGKVLPMEVKGRVIRLDSLQKLKDAAAQPQK